MTGREAAYVVINFRIFVSHQSQSQFQSIYRQPFEIEIIIEIKGESSQAVNSNYLVREKFAG